MGETRGAMEEVSASASGVSIVGATFGVADRGASILAYTPLASSSSTSQLILRIRRETLVFGKISFILFL